MSGSNKKVSAVEKILMPTDLNAKNLDPKPKRKGPIDRNSKKYIDSNEKMDPENLKKSKRKFTNTYNENTIFINNLSKTCKKKDIIDLFINDYPLVKVQIFKKNYKKFAIVDFKTVIDYQALQSKYNYKILHDKEIHIFKTKSHDTKDKIGNQVGKSKDTLLVKNLPFYATKNEIAFFFSVPIDNVNLIMKSCKIGDSPNDIYYSKIRNIGMAFIKFDTFESKNTIDELQKKFNNLRFQGRVLTVFTAKERPSSTLIEQ